ncbi:MAG TPA: hypothetical protein VJR02_04730 [Pyrinomonadaceae bacterium]|nr:hypothetical protein [Pyrinomonadaceae bacterium]
MNVAEQDISRSLKTLIRGLTQDDVTEMYKAYKALFAVGRAAVPQIREAIFKTEWANINYPNEIRYLAGLVTLIHDLDESESEKIRIELVRNGCSPVVAHVLESIGSFQLQDFIRYDVRGFKIFEHKRLVTRQNVKRRLEQWLRPVPGEDLDQIERIYVLPKQDLDALGSYAPVLFCINLAWDNPSPRWSPMSWLNNFIIETTLYHEIGHHVHRHTFGQDPEQEADAENYADRMMANSSGHFLFRLARLLKRAIGSA